MCLFVKCFTLYTISFYCVDNSIRRSHQNFSFINFSVDEHHSHKQPRRRPDIQRYHPVAGHGRRHRDSDEGYSGQNENPAPLNSDSLEHDEPLRSSNDNKNTSDTILEQHGSNKRGEGRIRGDGSNAMNCGKDTHSQAKTEANQEQEKRFAEPEREQQEPAGAAKPTKKARKPDREFYQPGSRRHIQGKDSAAGRDEDKPPPRKNEEKIEQESQWNTEEREEKQKVCTQKQGGKAEVKGTQDSVKLAKSGETNKKQGNREKEKPPLPSEATVDKLTSKTEQLSIKEKYKMGGDGQDREEASFQKGGTIDKGRRDQVIGTKEAEEKVEKKKEKGNRRRRGEREKERNQDSRRESELDGGGRSDQGKAENDRKSGKTVETHQSKGRDNRRESKRGDNNNNNNQSKDSEKEPNTHRNAVRTVERSDKSSPSTVTPTSKRYSKSDIRRPRNRTYSSSSASSVTSLDGPGLGMKSESSNWPHLERRHNNRAMLANSREGRRSHLQSFTTNGESSTESVEESEMSDVAEDRRRKYREERLSAEGWREERQRPKGSKVGGQGILRVSPEKQVGTSSQNQKLGSTPRGRGGGILVLPARADIANVPEFGQRLLFGGSRGRAAARTRGGRGGGVRRLWDPNNPDQKPALTRTQSSGLPSLQQPVYLQTGTGYGQLHFLDTDDEMSSSPPVSEHFKSQQQAAAMAFYKFQHTDNPYCYPVPASSSHSPSPNTTQRYPHPYVGPYQMANGAYPGPGVGQFVAYRGYSQPGSGAGLTLEDVAQQARGELGRLLRAADAQELQLSNLLSRDSLSADGLDRMPQLR